MQEIGAYLLPLCEFHGVQETFVIFLFGRLIFGSLLFNI